MRIVLISLVLNKTVFKKYISIKNKNIVITWRFYSRHFNGIDIQKSILNIYRISSAVIPFVRREEKELMHVKFFISYKNQIFLRPFKNYIFIWKERILLSFLFYPIVVVHKTCWKELPLYSYSNNLQIHLMFAKN